MTMHSFHQEGKKDSNGIRTGVFSMELVEKCKRREWGDEDPGRSFLFFLCTSVRGVFGYFIFFRDLFLGYVKFLAGERVFVHSLLFRYRVHYVKEVTSQSFEDLFLLLFSQSGWLLCRAL